MQRAGYGLLCVIVGCQGEAAPGEDRDAGATSRADAATGAADAAIDPGETIWPIPDWPTGEPADFGFDEAALDEAADYSESIGGLCLLVIRDGTLVYERYWRGTTPTSVQKSWSIAKSFTAALVGIAITRGDIAGVDQSAADFIPAWQGTDKQAITIAHLLAMASGLHYELVNDNTWSVFTHDQTAEALANPLDAEPGSVWHYSNHGVQVFHEILRNATGVDPEQYAEQHLWGPIGMNLDGPTPQRTHWERDGAGNPTMYMSVHASCRDFARFGYLFLHRGAWNGARIIDEDYVAAALSPSQQLNRIYGYFWWLNGYTPAIDSTDDPFDGTMMNFAPDDLVSAQGIGQNFIDVVPSTRTIYVHMRPAPHDPFSNFFVDFQGTLDKLFRDGKQIEHKILLEKLLAASGDATPR